MLLYFRSFESGSVSRFINPFSKFFISYNKYSSYVVQSTVGCYSGFYGKVLTDVVREVTDLLVAIRGRNRVFNIKIWGLEGSFQWDQVLK